MKREKISEEQNKKLEMICIGVIIVFALISFLFSKVVVQNDGYKKVTVYVEDACVWQSDITDLKDEKIIVYTDEQGNTFSKVLNNDMNDIKESCEYNVIEIKDKKIRCIESNCPNKVCINHGTLKNDIDNDMIICAPHKMTVVYE